jgi:hypothetical protein
MQDGRALLRREGASLRDGLRWGRRFACRCGATMLQTSPGLREEVTFEAWSPPASTSHSRAVKAVAFEVEDDGWLGPARARLSFVVRCDRAGTFLVPPVSQQDRSGSGAGFVAWSDLAAARMPLPRGVTPARRYPVQHVFLDPGDIRRFLKDPTRTVLFARTASGSRLPVVLRPRRNTEFARQGSARRSATPRTSSETTSAGVGAR